MRILLTGGSGFLGSSIRDYYSRTGVEIVSPSRQELDIRNKNQVDSFFSSNVIDGIIHTAVSGGRRNEADHYSQMVENLSMFNNLEDHFSKVKKVIHFCSGAAFGRKDPIYREKEKNIFSSWPEDFYGLSKNIIARQCHFHTNVYNLRLFGCFGTKEKPDRFIKSAILSAKNKEPFIIHQNREMDFVYVEDVISVIDAIIHNRVEIPQDINLCYPQKHTLIGIASIVSQTLPIRLEVLDPDDGKTYSGDSNLMAQLNIPFVGLEKGIQKMISEC